MFAKENKIELANVQQTERNETQLNTPPPRVENACTNAVLVSIYFEKLHGDNVTGGIDKLSYVQVV
jgi:hypothetical protein